jgi:hypothetical protein
LRRDPRRARALPRHGTLPTTNHRGETNLVGTQRRADRWVQDEHEEPNPGSGRQSASSELLWFSIKMKVHLCAHCPVRKAERRTLPQATLSPLLSHRQGNVEKIAEIEGSQPSRQRTRRHRLVRRDERIPLFSPREIVSELR